MEPWRVEPGNNVLCHYGVKGMKWGVRKDRKRSENVPKQKGEWKQRAAKALKRKFRASMAGLTAYRKAQGVFTISRFFNVPVSSAEISAYVNIGKEYFNTIRKLRDEE